MELKMYMQEMLALMNSCMKHAVHFAMSSYFKTKMTKTFISQHILTRRHLNSLKKTQFEQYYLSFSWVVIKKSGQIANIHAV